MIFHAPPDFIDSYACAYGARNSSFLPRYFPLPPAVIYITAPPLNRVVHNARCVFDSDSCAISILQIIDAQFPIVENNERTN